MKPHPVTSRCPALAVTTLLGIAAFANVPVAHAAIMTTGGTSFRTGTPTPTLTITEPITFTLSSAVTGNGNFIAIVFDEWVTSDGNATSVARSPTGQNLSYQINGGTTNTTPISTFIDNRAGTLMSITANDGQIGFTAIPGTNGQKVTILPQSFTYASNAAFNPNIPTTFSGGAYLVNGAGLQVSDLVIVPEPSTWALLGVAGLALTLRRRAKLV